MEQMQASQTQVGQRLVWTLDLAKSFKHTQDGKELDLQRLYQLVLPYGAPFEEIYTVLEELTTELKRLEQLGKEQEAKALEEAKSQESSTQESSTQEVAAEVSNL